MNKRKNKWWKGNSCFVGSTGNLQTKIHQPVFYPILNKIDLVLSKSKCTRLMFNLLPWIDIDSLFYLCMFDMIILDRLTVIQGGEKLIFSINLIQTRLHFLSCIWKWCYCPKSFRPGSGTDQSYPLYPDLCPSIWSGDLDSTKLDLETKWFLGSGFSLFSSKG